MLHKMRIFYCICVGIFLNGLWKNSDAVRMTLTPNNVVIGGSNNPAVIPTTSQQELVMRCTPDGTSSIEMIYSLYLNRRLPTQNDFTTFAVVDTNNNPSLRDTAPQDIRTKDPRIIGEIVNGNMYSSFLEVRLLYSRMDCLDEAAYRCEINYRPINIDTRIEYSDASLGLTILPGNLQIEGARYDGFFSNPVQNMSTFDTSSQYEFTCMGEIGQSTSNMISWHRKIPPYLLNAFQEIMLTNPTDNIDQGVPTTTICPYTRETKLRYTPTDPNQDLIVRCEVNMMTNTGSPYTAVSHEFHLLSPNRISTSAKSTYSTGTVLILQTLLVILNVML